jgi:hypothetical protein
MNKTKIYADFNGIFGDILCLSHEETSKDEFGNLVKLHEGMKITAFDEDFDENGNRDDLIASGVAEHSPEWLQCHGSKWILRIDENGVYHQTEKLAQS